MLNKKTVLCIIAGAFVLSTVLKLHEAEEEEQAKRETEITPSNVVIGAGIVLALFAVQSVKDTLSIF